MHIAPTQKVLQRNKENPIVLYNKTVFYKTNKQKIQMANEWDYILEFLLIDQDGLKLREITKFRLN